MQRRKPFYDRTVWKFATANFCVTLKIEREHGYRYDGEDSDGETQRALDCGDYVAFTSLVEVEYDGEIIGRDVLGGSVYSRDTVDEFWTSHRDSDALNRNCSIMRAARGDNVSICHYFPDMVSQAISEARQTIAARRAALESMPRMRSVA